MAHITWEDIPGWFHFKPLYERVAADAPPGSLLVEVGVFCGKSLAFLAAKRGHDCRVVGIDTFLGSPEFAAGGVGLKTDAGTPFENWPAGLIAQQCIGHLSAAGVYDRVQLVASDSVRAASLFADGSAHMVLLDADHSYESVAADIKAWWPKVAPGGLLCGDDYRPEFPGVVRAVDEAMLGVTLFAEHTTGTWWAWKGEVPK